MNRLFAVITTILAVSLAVFAGGSAGAADLPLPEGFSSASGGGITLQWKVEGEALRVRVGAFTEGWLAVGFDPSRRMKDANMIIGYVENGEVFLEDHFGTGATSHSPDVDLGGSRDLSDVDGGEADGQTWLEFTIPLDSGDAYDKVLAPGRSYSVILAAGRSDDSRTYHGSNRAVVRIEL